LQKSKEPAERAGTTAITAIEMFTIPKLPIVVNNLSQLKKSLAAVNRNHYGLLQIGPDHFLRYSFQRLCLHFDFSF
jgi:hypothetical protein